MQNVHYVSILKLKVTVTYNFNQRGCILSDQRAITKQIPYLVLFKRHTETAQFVNVAKKNLT